MINPLQCILSGVLLLPVIALAQQPVLKKGEYIFRASGCYACHTDLKNKGPALAGGHRLETPFGVFISPNITPDPDTGIGKWTRHDFFQAMREGKNPKGKHYYPAFPYTAYTQLTDTDLDALWQYMRSVQPVIKSQPDHDLNWYTPPRALMVLWKMLYFKPGPYVPDNSRSQAWNRGAYLSRAAAHCGECHTPRSFLGGLNNDLYYAGNREGPDDSKIPNITPDRVTGIGKWSKSELATYLKSGLTPDSDYAGSLMADVIDNGLAHLSQEDIDAITTYIMSLTPINNRLVEAKEKQTADKEAWE